MDEVVIVDPEMMNIPTTPSVAKTICLATGLAKLVKDASPVEIEPL